MKEKFEELKKQLIEELENRDLVGEVIIIQDLINFPTKLEVISQEKGVFVVEDEHEDTREICLDELPIESLLDLI